MTTAATTLGAAKKRIDLQRTFTQSLMDSIDRGVGQLVDADMNKESTRLQALQVQQQLGIQALSIANSQLADDPVALPRLSRRDQLQLQQHFSQNGPRFDRSAARLRFAAANSTVAALAIALIRH